MKKALLVLIALALAVGIYSMSRRGASHSTSRAPSSLVHSLAPDFTLQDLEGKPLDLASYRGQVVLLDFWATWCTPCRGEIPHFVEFQDKYRGAGLQVIGISMDDSPKTVREFYQQLKMNYPVAFGTADMAETYGGVLGLPITFLIGRDGRVAAKYVGEVQMSTLQQRIESLLQAK